MAKTRQTPPTSAQQRLAAQRAAAARERIQTAQRRRRLVVVAASVGAVVLVAAVLVIVKFTTGGPDLKSGTKATTASATVTSKLASIPASVFDTVGVGTTTAAPTSISDTTSVGPAGKPDLLFIGAEYCPYCAAERWPLTVALSRFGTFSGLGQVRSSPTDVYANTATLTFHGSTYTSKYLSFTPREVVSNQVRNGEYVPLDRLTATERTLWYKYTDNKGTFPFLYLDGKYTIEGAEYDPQVLHGLDQQQIAADLSTPSSAVAKGVIGDANVLTADICTLTNGQPANVCTSSGVTSAAKVLARLAKSKK